MNVFAAWITLLSLIKLLNANSDENDEISTVNIDVKRIGWNENEEFGKKYYREPELFFWSNKSSPIEYNDESSDSDDFESSSVSPSRYLQPPLPFYSSSIHDFEAENLSPPSTSPWSDIQSTAKSYDNSSTIKSLKIYETTSSNSSSSSSSSSPTDESFNGHSFDISDPSRETKSFDSLRSVILNRSLARASKNRENQVTNVGHTTGDSISTNLIKVNRVKNIGVYRGNHKYQHNVNEVPVVRRNWDFPRESWKMPTKPANHFIYIDSESKFGSVPGIPGRDYPIHQEHIHHNLRNNAKRFACPLNPTHVYLPDYASRCQIFYVCFGSETGVPMVCPNGTLFSQELQVCDWWFNVNC